jgi:F-type H+-transporting ATPase subunit b
VTLLALAEGAIQLVPDGTILFHLAAVIAMVAVLNATLLRPINRILEERERRTKGRLTEAQRTLLTVEERLKDYERRMRSARAEGYALLERERSASTQLREQALVAVRSQVAAGLSQEKAKLDSESANVREQLRGDARNRAIEISRQILDRPITGETNSI